MKDRGLRKRQIGTVVSNKMDKTVVVSIERIVQHPIYKKYVRRRGKCVAHDAQNICGIGDKVMIVETRPLSKTKRWRVREIVEKAL
ncbi:MAG: 30S ribosomal protein S17 [Deltaproteobacteria bacterium]|jgi:small subunit ribosomal protein S17|nr:30S ribosomal protein S17 [Deltaproteobacteria bacterium]MBW1794920.1 30S ribosomal protein S17 [Deltaproteobacteria bacterium]MBW2331552.1 30S ribosomal protein S17 [Deltaproteobacteria bacterium]MCK4487369.1 30S ribosomal protein S17 [Desulfobacterales bacterium]